MFNPPAYCLCVQRDFVAQHYLIGGDWGAENLRHSHHFVLELRLHGSALDQHGYMVDIVDVERENVYMFEIQWATLVDHTIGFRESDLFPKWRAIIGPFFASPPQVEHWGIVPAAAGTE